MIGPNVTCSILKFDGKVTEAHHCNRKKPAKMCSLESAFERILGLSIVIDDSAFNTFDAEESFVMWVWTLITHLQVTNCLNNR